ncbi:MAG: hypothetical protein WKF37_24825 [Bryobacteraceae bacterium]
MINKPGGRILKGEEYIVDMDEHVWTKRRQNSEHVIDNITAGLRHVRRIDEQDVACRQFSKDVKRRLLN